MTPTEKEITQVYTDAMHEEIRLLMLEGQRRELDTDIKKTRDNLNKLMDRRRALHMQISEPNVEARLNPQEAEES